MNNAGIFRAEEFFDVTPDNYDRMMNVKGMFFGVQLAAKRMVRNDGGSIIEVSSIAGILVIGGYATYCTSKGPPAY